MPSRTDRGLMADWLWTVDRYLLAGILILMIGGLVLSFAASPPVAERIGVDSFHFVKRHAVYLVPSLILLFIASILSPRMIRRAALFLFIGSLLMLIFTLFFGFEAKGSRRWIALGSISIQPSEFIKPAFVILVAFLLAENKYHPDVPGRLFSFILMVVVTALLLAQPDFGQTMLVLLSWSALIFMAGLSWLWIIVLGLIGISGLVGAYVHLPHVAARINRFLDPASGDTFQVDRALESFLRGGWTGRGPGEGTIKRILPDSHADFVFAVAAEEFGIVLCLALVAVFAFVVFRGLIQSIRDQDPFKRLATAGLITLFGLQSCINLAVNLNLIPTKGMTLPFVSYGGSSLLAVGLSMGFVLGLTRRRYYPKKLAVQMASPHRPAIMRA